MRTPTHHTWPGQIAPEEFSGEGDFILETGHARRESPLSALAEHRRRVRGGRRAQREEFARLVAYARQLHRQAPEALPGLAQMLGRAAQARAMTRLLWRADGGMVQECDPHTALFDPSLPLTRNGRSLNDLRREVPGAHRLNLATAVVLPWPWERERLREALSNLRPGGAWGAWQQDSNHCIELWLPLVVGWVHGGNHSLTAGIVYGAGEVVPEVVYDISPVYRPVACDGVDFRRRHDGSRVAPVADLEMAGLIEVGRPLANKVAQCCPRSDAGRLRKHNPIHCDLAAVPHQGDNPRRIVQNGVKDRCTSASPVIEKRAITYWFF